MLPLVCLFLLVWSSWVQGAVNNQLIVSDWYKTRLQNSVVPPFRMAYTTLNKKIIERVVLVDPQSDEKNIKSLINSLKCAFETVHTQLRRANDASEQIRLSLEREEKMLLQKITSQENLVRLKERDVNETKIDLEYTQQKITASESAMNNYQQSVNAAEHNAQMAQNAVDKANQCGRRRRKKRFLGLCGLFNWSGSKNAHERLSLATHNQHSAKHRLTFRQQLITNQRFRHKTAKSQLKAATTQLNILHSKLHQSQTSLGQMASLTKDFKDVEIYLREILGSSAAFKDQLIDLFDFENVIEPLNNIYEQMINNKLTDSVGNTVSTETTLQINESSKKLKGMIGKSWNLLVEEEEDDINVPCLLMENN